MKKLAGDATNYSYNTWPTQNVLASGLATSEAVSHLSFKGLRKMSNSDQILLVTDQTFEEGVSVYVNGHFYFGQ